jgi:hypothetical protein
MSYFDLNKKEKILFIDWLEQNYQEKIYTDYDIEKMHDDMLDDCYEHIDICGYEYSPSESLRSVDPIAHRCSVADYTSQDFEEICTAESPMRVLYIRVDDASDLVDEFRESLESEEKIGE